MHTYANAAYLCRRNLGLWIDNQGVTYTDRQTGYLMTYI